MVKKKASKKGVNKSDNNFNRNLLIGVVILILIFVVVFNFAGKGYDEEGLGTGGVGGSDAGEIRVVSRIGGGEFASKKMNDICGEKKVALYAPRFKATENSNIKSIKVRIMPADRNRRIMEKLVSNVELTFYKGNTRVGNRHFEGAPNCWIVGATEVCEGSGEIVIQTPGLVFEKGVKYTAKMYGWLNADALNEGRGWERVTLRLLNIDGTTVKGDESVYWGGNSKYHTGKFTRVDNTGCSPESCADTDGGINYTVKGSVSGKNQAGAAYGPGVGSLGGGFEDSCSSSNTSISEWYCDGVKPRVDNHVCPCSNGVCLV